MRIATTRTTLVPLVVVLLLAACGGGSSGNGGDSGDPDVDAGDAEFVSVSVEVAGTGSGTVSSTPSGIDCGEDCNAEFEVGTSVTLEAIPDAGATFQGWGEDCTGTATTCDLTIESASEAVAEFSEDAVSAPLNDTGIDWCADGSNNLDGGEATLNRQNCDSVADDWPGQDAMQSNSRDVLAREGELEKVGYGAAGFDFTKLDDDGNDLSVT